MDIAIVTGASSGIGREFVYLLDEEGLDEIWVIARREERLQTLQNETCTRLRILACDLREREVFDGISHLLDTEKPHVCYLINSAGFGKIGSFADIPLDDLLDMIDLNCRAAVALTQVSIPFMPRGSHILEICSSAAFQPLPYLNVYAATKALLYRYSRALRVELAPQGIVVTAVCPYWIRDTEFIHVAQKTKNSSYIHAFPWASTQRTVALRSLRAAKNNVAVVTPGLIPFLHRIITSLLPHSFMMAASRIFHKL
jgi:uncharacterized protein